jgi:hypothetical protein
MKSLFHDISARAKIFSNFLCGRIFTMSAYFFVFAAIAPDELFYYSSRSIRELETLSASSPALILYDL